MLLDDRLIVSEEFTLLSRQMGASLSLLLKIKQNKLREINLAYKGADIIRVLSQVLKRNTSVKRLILSGSMIRDRGAFYISEALKRNTSLQEIDLRSNRIGIQGIKAIAEALKVNSDLRKINLSMNPLQLEGAQALAEAIAVNSSLEFLDLRQTYCGEEGATSILKALEINIFVEQVFIDLEASEKTRSAITRQLFLNKIRRASFLKFVLCATIRRLNSRACNCKQRFDYHILSSLLVPMLCGKDICLKGK